MLKPSDVTAGNDLNDHAERAAIEAYIDRSLKDAKDWPCVVQRTRGVWRERNIDAVLKAYEALGWVVEPHRGGGMARFSHPTPVTGESTARAVKVDGLLSDYRNRTAEALGCGLDEAVQTMVGMPDKVGDEVGLTADEVYTWCLKQGW